MYSFFSSSYAASRTVIMALVNSGNITRPGSMNKPREGVQGEGFSSFISAGRLGNSDRPGKVEAAVDEPGGKG